MSGYLSKNGYVLKKEELTTDELREMKKELIGRPIQDDKYAGYNKKDNTFPLYIETKNKLYIPKIYGIKKFGKTQELPNYIGKDTSELIFQGNLYPIQIDATNALLEELKNGIGGGILSLKTGQGKCHAIDTPIMMFDGSIKKVQDIKVGDLLMGDDSTPRKVLSLARGIDDMYDIIPDKANKYTVNKEHILVLKNIKKTAYIKNIKNTENAFHVIWWENGNRHLKQFYDIGYAKKYLETIKTKHQQYIEISVKDYIKQTKLFKHHFKSYRVSVDFPSRSLPIDPYLLGKCTQCIPNEFKFNSRKNRLRLLAGLLDSNGSFDYHLNAYKLDVPNIIRDDIIYISHSLGFKCDSERGDDCLYISGRGIEEIPCVIITRQIKKTKDVLSSSIKVKYVGQDNYYGFTIDGNNRYLLGDFTVTHNTISTLYVLSQLQKKAIIIVNKITLMKQWETEIKTFLPTAKVGFIQGQKNVDIYDKDIVIAMLQSLAKIDYPKELFQDFGVTVTDECHNTSSKVFSKVLMKLCSLYTIGLTATPNRSDGCEYVFKWFLGDIAYVSKAIRKGLDPVVHSIKIDSSEYKEISIESKITGQKQIQYSSMINELISMTKRNKLVIELLKDLVNQKRKILVLSDRRNHLMTLKKLFDTDPFITFTVGMFIGQMKISDLEKSKACDVILATYSAFSEGVSVKDLNTLLLITPKKFIGHLKNTTKNENGKMEQIVGRIFRKEHTEIHPLIVDLHDNFSIYKNQANQRKTFYKQHFNKISIQDYSINLDEYTLENINISSVKLKNTKTKNTPQQDDQQLHSLLSYNCILDD